MRRIEKLDKSNCIMDDMMQLPIVNTFIITLVAAFDLEQVDRTVE